MKTKSFLLSLLAAILMPLTASAEDYHDITSYYLTNNLFDSDFDHTASETGNVKQEILNIDGWTKDFTEDYTITGIYQYGTAITFNGASVPATGYDGTANGGCLALSTGWNVSLKYFQDVELPAGKYKLVTALYNGYTKTVGSSLAGWLPTGKTAVMSAVSSFASNEWIADTISFELKEVTKGKIQIGFKAGPRGSDNSAKIVVDYIKLLRDTPYGDTDVAVYKNNLMTAITDAKTLYGTGSGNGATDLLAAIKSAETLYNDAKATIEQIENEMLTLAEAVEKYLWLNPTGDKPTVTTDKRFARGATMAFARMTVSGKEIVEQGICWAENDQPTINDSCTTAYLTNNGKIYWLKGLKPGTEYYMRAYAITKGRQVGYGDIIRFYTIPKGTIGYTIRSSSDAAATQRITNAVKAAAYWWNNLTEIKHYYSSVGHVSGVPTADCSYGGWVRVGDNQSYQKTGTILHEWLHGVGVIPWADTEWSRHTLRSGVNGDGFGTGTWLGDRVTEVIRFLDNNSTGTLGGDYQHMWPWGINGAHEDNGSDMLYIGNSLVCQALGEDGLQHTKQEFAQPYHAFNHENGEKYYIKSESADHGLNSSFLTVNTSGQLVWKTMTKNEALSNDSAAWHFTFTASNQYYQIRNAATGCYITYASTGNNGFKTVARSQTTAAENLHIMRSRINVSLGGTTINHRGYWIIHPTNNWTPPCLAPKASGVTGTATFDIKNSATTQRWLILKGSELDGFMSTAIKGMIKEANASLDHLKTLCAVPHIEDSEGIDASTQQFINTTEQQLANASISEAELTAIISGIQQATYNFLCNATPSDITKPFDLTSLISNPGMDVTTGWSASPSIEYSTGEFYQQTFDMSQTYTKLPAGTYQFCLQGFQRPGASATAYTSFIGGTNNVTAFIYAGGKSQKIAHIASEAQTAKIGKGNESAVGSPVKYMPNDRQAARAYFDKGLYENRIGTTVATDGASLKAGVRAGNMPASYWCCFDNFRLYFFGNINLESVNAIKTIETAQQAASIKGIYSIDGRLISTDISDLNSLKPGIYIINGKKIIK